ncbi:hypothetical protein EGK65_02655 [Citrobacter farmeri]|nr:hypothetical protein EGK65_02655 [Citrobacter farmeri]
MAWRKNSLNKLASLQRENCEGVHAIFPGAASTAPGYLLGGFLHICDLSCEMQSNFCVLKIQC